MITVPIWRWDQGRLDYFLFEKIRSMAECLAKLDGIDVLANDSRLRLVLMDATDLPFAPNKDEYPIWRNYARVFMACLLAVRADNRLIVTDLCKKIADKTIISVDEYFSFYIPRFYCPSPFFSNYNNNDNQIFPFCATIKFLASREDYKASLDDIIDYVMNNRCTGLEDLDFYKNLKPHSIIVDSDVKRQVREMLIFLCQMNILKWHKDYLYLDIEIKSSDVISEIFDMSQPIAKPRNDDRLSEIIALGAFEQESVVNHDIVQFIKQDIFFTEGKRVMREHFRTERSANLRNFFFADKNVYICDACNTNPKDMYPWINNILEIHHLLPLSSSVMMNSKGTSIDDVVAICPNCHKSIHTYYKIWLETNNQEDFVSKLQAKQAYEDAKTRIVL